MTTDNPFEDDIRNDMGILPRKVDNAARFMIAEELMNGETKAEFLRLVGDLWPTHASALKEAQRIAESRVLGSNRSDDDDADNIRWTGRMYTIEVLTCIELSVDASTIYLVPNLGDSS